MSELIKSRKFRQEKLKELILQLHEGKSPEEVKGEFADIIKDISPAEISEMEQNLIMEGMPIEEIQRLCDVHAAVFKGSIEEIHHPEKSPGHPMHTFNLENDAITDLIEARIKPDLEKFKKDDGIENLNKLKEDINLLLDIDKHFSRKENLLFPYLEKYGITAPPKVMWGVDDEIRDDIKQVKSLLNEYNGNRQQVAEKIDKVIFKVNEMLFKEKSILFPMALENLSEDDWISIEEESDEIGYCLVEPEDRWRPVREDVGQKMSESEASSKGMVKFDTGILSFSELEMILNTLPIDITFIDKDGVVKYFSRGKNRIFVRTKAVIGRTVQNCHPPASVHIVEELVEDFKTGKKDSESFWLRMGDVYVYIRYFAVRDENNNYIGTLEVTQDINPIQEIKGEKRLLSD